MHIKQLLAQSLLWRGFHFISILLLNIVLSRYLQAQWIGWVFYLSNFFSLIVLIASLNLDSAITYFGAAGKINANKLLWFGSVCCVGVVAVVWVALHLFSGWLPLREVFGEKDIIYIAVFYIAGIIVTNISTSLFYSMSNFLLPNLITVLLNSCLIVFILLQKNNDLQALKHIVNVYFFFFLIQGFVLAATFAIRNNSWREMKLPSRRESKDIYRYAMMALMANVVFFFVYRMDYWFVQYYCDGVQMGNYVQVSKLGQTLLLLPQIMASAVFPQTAGDHDRAVTRQSIMVISRWLTAFYVVIVMVAALTGRWLFPFLFGQTFSYMYFPFLIILPGIWALSVLALLAAYFGGKGNVKINVVGGSIAVAVMAAGDIAFLSRGGGIVAAAVISSVSYFVYLVYLMKRFKSEYSVHVSDFIFLRKSDLPSMQFIVDSKDKAC